MEQCSPKKEAVCILFPTYRWLAGLSLTETVLRGGLWFPRASQASTPRWTSSWVWLAALVPEMTVASCPGRAKPKHNTQKAATASNCINLRYKNGRDNYKNPAFAFFQLHVMLILQAHKYFVNCSNSAF